MKKYNKNHNGLQRLNFSKLYLLVGMET